MLQKVFAVKNILSGISSGLYLFPTEAQAAVDLAVNLAPRQYSVKDQQEFINTELQLFCVGEFNIESNELLACPARLVAWDFRRMKETPMNMHTGTPQDIESRFVQDTSDVR